MGSVNGEGGEQEGRSTESFQPNQLLIQRPKKGEVVSARVTTQARWKKINL